jgi:hypothetical protein
MESKTLILFVHGFLGSESSFDHFPLDLVHSIRNTYQLQNIEARIFPFFSTKGNPDKSITLLYNWLVMNASGPEYEAVIIVCHSMGGLIVADAYQKVLSHQSKKLPIETPLDHKKSFSMASADIAIDDLTKITFTEDKKDITEIKETLDQEKKDSNDSKSGWFGSFWTKSKDSNDQGEDKEQYEIPVADETLTSLPVEPELEDERNHEYTSNTKTGYLDKSSNINIIAIICFDSPFYGLNSNVFTVAASEHAAEIISSYVPERHSTKVKSGIIYGSSVATSAVTTSVNAVSYIPQASVNIITSIPRVTTNIVTSIPQATGSVLLSAIALPGAAISVLPAVGNGIVGTTKATSSAIYGGVSSVNSSIMSYWSGSPKDEYKEPAVDLNAKEEPQESVDNNSDYTEKPSELVKEVDREEERKNAADREELEEECKNDSTISLSTIEQVSNDLVKKEHDGLIAVENQSWTPIIGIGLTTLVGFGAYYYAGSLIAMGSYSFIRRAALAYAVSHADGARQHLQFLYPIWAERVTDNDKRVDFLVEAANSDNFMFKCYYIEVHYC